MVKVIGEVNMANDNGEARHSVWSGGRGWEIEAGVWRAPALLAEGKRQGGVERTFVQPSWPARLAGYQVDAPWMLSVPCVDVRVGNRPGRALKSKSK